MMQIDLLARRWGGPDGGPDGMAQAVAYLAFTLAEMGHNVRAFGGEDGFPGWTHSRIAWIRRVPLFTPIDWTAGLVVTTIHAAWRRTAIAASEAKAGARLVYWHHFGPLPQAMGGILAAPPAVAVAPDWRRSVVLPPSSWAVEGTASPAGDAVLVPGVSRSKGGQVAYQVAAAIPDVRFFVLPGRAAANDVRLWRRLPNVEIAPGRLPPPVFLGRSLAVLSPTRGEIHPLTLVEAAARSLPIVCSDLPGTRAAVGAVGHYLAPNAPIKDWIKSLRAALAGPSPEPPPLRHYAEVVAEVLGALTSYAQDGAKHPTARPVANKLRRPGSPVPSRREPPHAAARPAPPSTSPKPHVPAAPATPAAPTYRRRTPGSGAPRILILADTRNWAWAKKAAAIARHAGDAVEIEVAYQVEPGAGERIRSGAHDLYHTFEFHQVSKMPPGWPIVTGLTAHVWKQWDQRRGAGFVRSCFDRAVALHANSRMLQAEIEGAFLRPVCYVPNGVDPKFWRRLRPRTTDRLVVGFVGRPSPRKGADIIREACSRVGVELRTIERRSQNAITSEEIREFYQDIHVLAVSSDMDGTPNPALEASACDCAVVSNRIGNMPEFIEHGTNGLITERTVDSLAAALRQLAEMPLGEVEAMGRAARATVEAGWTWAHQAPAYVDMWLGAVRMHQEAAA